MTVKLCPPNAFISSGYQTLRLDRSYQGKDQHTVLLDYMLRLFFLGPHGFKWLKRTGWVVENCPFKRPHQRPKTRPIQAKVYGNFILKNSLDFHTSVPPCCSVIYSFFLSFLLFLFLLSLSPFYPSFLSPFLSFFLPSFLIIKNWILLLWFVSMFHRFTKKAQELLCTDSQNVITWSLFRKWS